MKMEKIDRILVAVKDLETSAEFFSNLLGLKFDKVWEEETQQVKYARCSEGFELIQSTSPDGPVARFIEKRGEGLYAIIFKHHDMDAAIKEMEVKGVKMVSRPTTGRLQEAYFHPKDAHGVMIGLCEYEEKHGASVAEGES